MSKLLRVVLAILFAVTGAYAANMQKSNAITAGASGSVQLNQISYSAGSSVQIDYSYAGLPVKTGDVLVLQTLCSGAWNGMDFDTSTQFFQSDPIVYSSSSGSAVDVVTIPDTYQGSGSCTVSFYLLFTVNNTRYSKTLATSTFSVVVP
jgi:hypothetical protein